MITFKQKGDFSAFNRYTERLKEVVKLGDLNKYGRQGVDALKKATPRDTGETANSWSYDIVRTKDGVSISFNNSNIQNGVPIAIIIQYGHATKNGAWIEGRDYINPAVRPVFDKITEDAWREVRKL